METFVRAVRLLLVLSVALASVGAPVVGTQDDGPFDPFGDEASQQVDPDTTEIVVDLHANGTAAWQVAYRVQLDTENETEAFQDLKRDIEENPGNYTDRFAQRIRTTVRAAENATGRQMTAEDFTVDARVESLPTEAGVVVYRFEWVGFAAVDGDRLRAGDAIDDFYLGQGTELRFRWSGDYRVGSVTPQPDDTRQRLVIWRGGETAFVEGEPRLVLEPGTPTDGDGGAGDGGDGGAGDGGAGDGGDGGAGDGDDGGGVPTTALVVVAAVVLLAAGGWWYYRRNESPEAPTDGPTATDAGANGPDATATGGGDGGGPAGPGDGPTATGDDTAAGVASAAGGAATADDATGGGETTAAGGQERAVAEGDAVTERDEDDDLSEVPAELLSNEEQVIRFLRERGGRAKQQEIVDALGWTEAKTSQVLGDMREDGTLDGFRLGRENVITLPDEDESP